MFRLLMATAVLGASVPPARAQLDADLTRPYHLRVALRVARHRLLTPVFKDKLERELRGSLQAALGDMGRVEIVDLLDQGVADSDPLLREVEAKGLQQGLDGWHRVSDVKTHFVFVDFVNGAYEIQARQHDGPTGLASPLVRHVRTYDRDIVGRTAALLVDADFGVVGTLGRPQGEGVEVALQGGRLGVPLDRWLQKDDVFAIAQVNQAGGGRQSLRMPWALLQVVSVDEKAGTCQCQLWHRFDPALPEGAGVLGYRCLKLSTSEAPLRLRLVRNDGSPLNRRQIWVNSQGFSDKPREQLTTNAQGLVETQEPYRHIAFVRVVAEGTQALARIPVEILDDRVVTCPIDPNQEVEKTAQIQFRRDNWVKRVLEDLQVQNLLVRQLSATVEKEPEKTLEHARRSLKDLEADLANLKDELATLRQAANRAGAGTKLDLNEGERLLQELHNKRDDLTGYIKTLEETVAKKNDPKVREWQAKLAQAGLQEKDAEFGKAIELYKQVLAEAKDAPNVKQHLDELEKGWAIKGKQHEEARKFIYETWPTFTTAAQLKKHLQDARDAFVACRDAGDRLSPQKMQKINVEHANRLAKESDALRQQSGEDAKRAAETVKEAADGLKELYEKVAQFERSGKEAGK